MDTNPLRSMSRGGETGMTNVKVTVSACILARNEEGRIEEALRSLKAWADQILVLDNESSDGTAAVACRYADAVISVTTPQDGLGRFDALRNEVLPHATGDWIFYLDADERVPPRLGEELRRLLREQGDQFAAV